MSKLLVIEISFYQKAKVYKPSKQLNGISILGTVQFAAEPYQELLGDASLRARACFQTLYLPMCCEEDPPQPPLKRGENRVKVPLFNSDLGGSPRMKRNNE